MCSAHQRHQLGRRVRNPASRAVSRVSMSARQSPRAHRPPDDSVRTLELQRASGRGLGRTRQTSARRTSRSLRHPQPQRIHSTTQTRLPLPRPRPRDAALRSAPIRSEPIHSGAHLSRRAPQSAAAPARGAAGALDANRERQQEPQ